MEGFRGERINETPVDLRKQTILTKEEIEEAKEKITKLEGIIQTEGIRKQPQKDAVLKEAEEEEYQRRLRRERRVKNKRAIGIFIPTIIIGLLLLAAQIYFCIQFGQFLVFEFAALSVLIYGLLLIAVKTMATKRGLGIAMGIITRILSIMGMLIYGYWRKDDIDEFD